MKIKWKEKQVTVVILLDNATVINNPTAPWTCSYTTLWFIVNGLFYDTNISQDSVELWDFQ